MKFSYSNPFHRHLLRIFLMVGVYFFIIYSYENRQLPNTPILFIIMLIEVLLFYSAIAFNNHVIVKYLFKHGKYKWFVIAEIITLPVVSFLTLYYQVHFSPFYHKIGNNNTFIFEIVNNGFYFLFGMAIYFMDLWIDDKIYKTNTKLQNKEAELNFLKSQINPHFLLNALNNLYGYALAEPNKVADKIYELSELLKYQITALKKTSIDLEQEVIFINQYVQYELNKNIHLQVKINTHFQPIAIEVPPLIYLPLVENAIKYSLESDSPLVEIDWYYYKDNVQFIIKNNFDKQFRKSKSTQTGIENLQKRLEIYPNKNEFTYTENQTQFTANLILWNK